MEAGGGRSGEAIRLVEDVDVRRLKDLNRLDPGLRTVLGLLRTWTTEGDAAKRNEWIWEMFRRLTGIQRDRGKAPTKQYFPLLVEFSWPAGMSSEVAERWLKNTARLDVGQAYFGDGLPKYATAWFGVRSDAPGESYPEPDRPPFDLRDQIVEILNDEQGFVTRLELPGAAQAFNEDALVDVGLARPGRRGSGTGPDGTGVIIGIIDDGCALAHPNFIREAQGGVAESRIRWLWDQGRSDPAPQAEWQAVTGYAGHQGYELDRNAINRALAKGPTHNNMIDEQAVYAYLKHEIADLASHGTHVMDIAAGNGRALMSTPGAAPNADLIFVQLPTQAISSGGTALDAAILDGVRYIFERAGSSPVVINISYGGYRGPHNGRSIVECAIDEELAKAPNRAVVVAAGNGFVADCHAWGSLAADPAQTTGLDWIVKPEDPTANLVEIWYADDGQLELQLAEPGGAFLPAVPLGTTPQDLVLAGTRIGQIDHQAVASTGLNRIAITLNPTGTESVGPSLPSAPWGKWRIRLRNTGTKTTQFHAWIERDTAGRAGGSRRMQSHFDEGRTGFRHSLHTLGSYATGGLTIAVGGYNVATQQVARYSSCGPATHPRRQKPEVLAPAEEDAAGRGILSASSCSARPSRMGGTSAAAPLVAGMAALMLQQAVDAGRSPSAAQLRRLLMKKARNAPPAARTLRPNARIDADARRRIKQGDPRVWKKLIGSGKARA